jgi:hypothetical protein
MAALPYETTELLRYSASLGGKCSPNSRPSSNSGLRSSANSPGNMFGTTNSPATPGDQWIDLPAVFRPEASSRKDPDSTVFASRGSTPINFFVSATRRPRERPSATFGCSARKSHRPVRLVSRETLHFVIRRPSGYAAARSRCCGVLKIENPTFFAIHTSLGEWFSIGCGTLVAPNKKKGT